MRTALNITTVNRESIVLLAPAMYLLVLPMAHVTALRSIAFWISVLLLLWTMRARATPSIPLKIPFAAWFLIALLSLIWAVHPEYSIGEIKAEIIYGFLSFLIFFHATRSSHELRLWAFALSASALAIALIALIHFLRGLNPYPEGVLWSGALSYAAYLTTVLPMLVAMTILRPGYRRVAMLCLIPVLLLIAFWTTNRGVWLYLLVEAAVFGGLYLIRAELHPKTKKAAITIVVASMIVLTGSFFYAAKGKLGLTGGPGEIIAGTAEADKRPQLWIDSITWIRKRPFTGAGFGIMVLGRELQKQQKDLNHTHAHNILLNYALQLGLAGPFLIAFLFYSVARQFWKLIRSSDKELQTFGIAGMAIVSGVLAAGMIEDLFARHNGWLFWSLVGILLGYAMNKRADVPGSTRTASA
jgi:O-antigen ligase